MIIWQSWWYYMKFDMPLLSQGKAFAFAKIRQFCWSNLKIWTAPIITSWNFCKNVSFVMKPFEHLNCPIIMRYNSIKCKAVLMMSLLLTPLTFPYYYSFNVTYHHIAPIIKFPRKIKPSLEIHMKIWPASRIMS